MNNEFPKTVSLPSGKTASITRKGKVRDLVFAARIVGKSEADNQFALSVAAMAPTDRARRQAGALRGPA